jgi:hypothetical protein
MVNGRSEFDVFKIAVLSSVRGGRVGGVRRRETSRCFNTVRICLRRRTPWLPLRRLCVALSLLLSHQAFAQNKPTVVITPDRVIGPAVPLREVIPLAESIVSFRVVEPGAAKVLDRWEEIRKLELRADPGGRRSSTEIATIYKATVLRILKGSAHVGVVGAAINVGHEGGTGAWKGGTAVVQRRVPDLVVGEEYLAFLNYEDRWGALIFDDRSTFNVRDERLQLLEPSSTFRPLNGKTMSEAAQLFEEFIASGRR